MKKVKKAVCVTCANLHRAFITIYRSQSLSSSSLKDSEREAAKISQFIKK